MRDWGIRESAAASETPDARAVEPGKHTRTEAVQRAAPPSAAPPVLATATAPTDLSYGGLFGVDLDRAAGGFGNQTTAVAPGAAPGAGAATPTAALTADDFDVAVNWAVPNNAWFAIQGANAVVGGPEIDTWATVSAKPGVDATPTDYTVGFIQTLLKSTRASVYVEDASLDDAFERRAQEGHAHLDALEGRDPEEVGPHQHGDFGLAMAEAAVGLHEHQRRSLSAGPMLDILGGPAPWFDAGQNDNLGYKVHINDHPTHAAPMTSKSGRGKLARSEGGDKFLTHLVVTPRSGPMIFLAWSTWHTTYNGDFSEGYSGADPVHGGLDASGTGKHGSPVTSGAPANQLLDGEGAWTWTPPPPKPKHGKKKKKKAP